MAKDNFKFLKKLDLTFTEVDTYVKTLRKNNKRTNNHKTVHRSKAAGILTVVFGLFMLLYVIYLLDKMYSDIHN